MSKPAMAVANERDDERTPPAGLMRLMGVVAIPRLKAPAAAGRPAKRKKSAAERVAIDPTEEGEPEVTSPSSSARDALRMEVEDLEERYADLRAKTEIAGDELALKEARLRELESEDRTRANLARLGKLPPELWTKILTDEANHVEEKDCVCLALTCKFFRQKEQEVRSRHLWRNNLRTDLADLLFCGQLNKTPASESYLNFLYQMDAYEDEERKNELVMALAAMYGYLPLLKRIKRDGFRWAESEILEAAARGGHKEVLIWLRQEGAIWDEYTARGAGEGGQLEVLKWLKTQGCPWNEDCTRMAAFAGRLDVLKWAVANGCPFDPEFCRDESAHSFPLVAEWIEKNHLYPDGRDLDRGCEFCDSDYSDEEA